MFNLLKTAILMAAITALFMAIGAFVGGWLFRTLGVASPLGGLAGTILVAFIGAVVLLFIIHLIRRNSRRV